MFRALTVLFLVVPFVELWLLLRVGSLVGFWPTMGLVLGTAMLGAWLAKREGLRVLGEWQRAMTELRVPEEGLTSGLLVLVGATLLITPGVLTDVVGLALLFPPTRRLVARLVERHARARFTTVSAGPGGTVFTTTGRAFGGAPFSGGPFGGGGFVDVRVVTPRGVYAQRRESARRGPRVVDVEGSIVEEHTLDAGAPRRLRDDH